MTQSMPQEGARRRTLEQRQSRLTATKRKLLERWKKGGEVVEERPATIPRRRAGEPIPLSFAQQRFWVLDQMEPGSAAYNVPAGIELVGHLDGSALARAIERIVERHEALRTRFESTAGAAPVQVVEPVTSSPLPLLDLSPLEDAEEEASKRMAFEARQPFDLARGPLLRSLLIRLAPRRHVLLLTVHHIACDGWSIEVLVKELALLYSSRVRGEEAALQELPVQYPDYAAWQREWLEGEVLETQLAYWRQALEAIPARSSLPTDSPPSVEATYRSARRSFEVPAPLVQALQALGRAKGGTLFITSMAAFMALIYRTTGHRDLVVGTPVANRPRVELEGLIGLFVNALALRLDCGGEPSFGELLARLQKVAVAAYGHQDLPFEQLVENLQPDRDLGQSPIFQMMFALQGSPLQPLRLPGLEVSLWDVASGTARFDLVLNLLETQSGLRGTFEFRSDLFDGTTIERFGVHLLELLRGAAADPDRPLAELPLLTRPQQHQLLREWNDRRESGPAERTLMEPIRRWWEQAPEAVALVRSSQYTSYGSLRRTARGLARRLLELGVGPEVPVALHFHRSPEAVLAILGVLEAGAFYIPLDPTHPEDRLRFMLEDSGAHVLVTQSRDSAPTLDGVTVLELKAQAEGSSSMGEFEAPASAGGNLAYVLYTSGSTGYPKGVGCHPLGVLNLLADFEERRALAPSSKGSWWTNTSFDVSVYEIFSTLLAGGALHVVDEALYTEGPALVEWLIRHRIESSYLPPFLLEDLAARIRQEPKALSLRRLLVGVEPISESLLLEIDRGLPELCIINGYGPTEATVCATLKTLGGPATRGDKTPIGRPVWNTEIYLLGPSMVPVPPGASGELHIGGRGVARAYYRRPGLTAEHFIPDPFSRYPGARLYRTGDLARQRPNGEVEFLGRRDNQVKVRGFRIELGGIEAALGRHPGLRRAIVRVLNQGSSAPRLVAYCVVESEPAPTSEALRAFLSARLPGYMVPSAFVLLPEVPLLPSGKVNLRALPDPVDEGGELQGEAPRTPTEKVLAAIWCQALGLERFGIHDNFFELGGHSLLATQMLSKVRESFPVEISLRRFFEVPTLAALAAEIAAEGSRDEAPPLVPVPRRAEHPLSFAQQRLWVVDQLAPGSSLYNIPVAVRLRGPVRPEHLEESLDHVVQRQESLRTRFPGARGKGLQQVVSLNGFRLPLVDLGGLAESVRERVATQLTEEEMRRPFDLSRAPLLRAALLRLAAEEWILLLTIHHIVSDGWSMGILMNQVMARYEELGAGRPAELPAPPIQYIDFAHWQRQWLQDELLEQLLAYWRDALEGLPETLHLPTDRPAPAVRRGQGASLRFQLSPDLCGRMRSLAAGHGSTLFMALLGVFQILLLRLTGERDFGIGSPIANRGRTELEGLIGFFVNTLVLRSDLVGEPSFGELLRRVRKTTVGAYAHQDLPFELLIEDLAPERSLSNTPLFQVMFGLLEGTLSRREPTRLTLDFLPVDTGTAKFDLSLLLQESGGGINGQLEYSTDRFDRTTASRLVAAWCRLLEGIDGTEAQSLLEIPVHRAAERQQLLTEWNASPKVDLRGETLHELFQQRAAAHPERVALVCAGQRLTYGELDARSSALAAALRARGAGYEVPVGLCLERTPHLVVGMLGILKAGSAYLPLDPAYPEERLAWMLEDSGAPWVLTEASLCERFEGTGALPLLLEKEAAVQAPEEALPGGGGAEALAYLIYTSGSTGRPKGVAIDHGSAVAMVSWAGQAFPQRFFHSVLAGTSVCFDLSVFELFVPLTTGGRVVLVRDVLQVPELPESESVTLVNTVPSAMAELVRLGRIPSSVQAVNLAGEPLRRELVEGIYRLGQVESVFNLYGPSEDTTYSTFARIPRCDSEEPSIGRPVNGTQAYVVGEGFRPAPFGVPGELLLGGAGLARGYWRRPALTAQKFVPDSWSGEEGRRLYRTGDRVRYRASGELDFLGRMDFQVKVRGFRIELGEIESVMGRHPALSEVVVVARRKASGALRVVAYLVAAPGETLEQGELRTWLGAKLPEYMLPTAYVVLEALPLTPNGKVDRKALPEPEASRSSAGGKRPTTANERILAAIWSRLLEVDEVKVEDNFFELGGDSILGIQVVAAAKEEGLGLNPRDLFKYQTLGELARFARSETGSQADQNEVVGDVPLTPIQSWFFERDLPATHYFNQAVLLTLRQPLEPTILRRALAALESHHDALRLRFSAGEDGVWHQRGMPSGGEVPTTKISLERLPREARERALGEAAERLHGSLDPEDGPLYRMACFDHGPEESGQLLWIIHHLAVDGVSWRVLVEDLERAYLQAAAGREIELPAKTTSFKRWSEALWDFARTPTLRRELETWEKRPPRPLRSLPIDHFRGGNTAASARMVSAVLEASETQELLSQLPKIYRTRIDEVLLAALAQTLGDWTGERRALVDIEGHGREEMSDDLDLSRTVGWLTSLYPVCLDLSRASDPGEVLKVTKEKVRGIPRRGLGFAVLRYLGEAPIQQRLAQLQEPEIVFNYLGQLDQAVSEASLFALSDASSGPVIHPRNPRSHLLEVNGSVRKGRLHTYWIYSENLHRRDRIEGLAEAFLKTLRRFLEHCRSRPSGDEYTPSDFPEARMEQGDLNKLLSRLKGRKNV